MRATSTRLPGPPICTIIPPMPQPRTPVRKQPLSRRAPVLQLLASAVILLVGWGFWRQGQPERLLVLDAFVPQISHGVVYRTGFRDPSLRLGPVILCRPIFGGERVLVEEDEKVTFADSPGAISVTDGAIIYGIHRYKKPRFGGGFGSGAS